METVSRDKTGRVRRESQSNGGKRIPNASGGTVTGKLRLDDMPEDLGEYGTAFWVAASESMEAIGILERADRMMLEMTARTWQRYKEAVALLATPGVETYVSSQGGKARHPAVITIESAERELQRQFGHLGLTPSARAKFGPTPEKDPFAELMSAN